MAIPEEIQEKVLEEAISATPNYSIDYGSQQFKDVDASIKNQETQIDQTYGGMISEAGKYYDDLKNATQQWADKQAQIQQENTDFAIEKIEQEKEQANKDYKKEQSGAYVDWRKQSNQYGTEAEKMASAGLANTGFSESSQVSMYNTYQNRVAMARETYNRAVLNYNNAIKDAQLQNNAALAEIAYQSLQQQLELSLQGFQYKNQLILEQANKKTELENIKWNRYQDVLQQMNTENALKEDIRQYNETQKWQTEQAELDRTFKAQEAELDRTFQANQAEIERKFKAQQAELDKKHEKEMLKAKTKAEKEILEQQHKNDLAKLKKQQEYEMAQLDEKLKNDKALLKYENDLKSTTVKGSSSGSSSKPSSSKKSSTGSKGVTIAKTTGKAKPVPTFSNREQAINYLRKNYDIPNASGILTFNEWSRRKNANSGSMAIKASSSYGEYLKLEAEYLIDQYAR